MIDDERSRADMKQHKLFGIQKGYAEVWISLVGDFDLRDNGPGLDGIGYVHKESFVERSDFENDIVTYRTSWVPYLYRPTNCNSQSYGYERVGKLLGYATRKEAVEALVSIVEKRVLAKE